MMKAAIFTKYGGPEVIKVRNINKPSPRQNEILIKVRATTVCTGDWRVLGPNAPAGFGLFLRLAFGITGPRVKILGQEVSGVVEEVGANVTEFEVGDEVFGTNDVSFGAHAEYLSMKADFAVIKKPSNLDMCESAAIPFGGLTSLFFLRDLAKLSSGENVLINGASGCLGTFAIQLAKILSPDCKVTAVCSARNEEMVRALGADEVVDYSKTDFTKGSGKYDVIYDTIGSVKYSEAKRVMSENSVLMTAVPSLGSIRTLMWNWITGNKQKYRTGTPDIGKGDENQILAYLKQLIEEGKLKPIIDSKYSLDNISDAFRLVDSGHKRGNAVVVISE